MPRSATVFILPDPSVVDVLGNRKHFYFFDYDDVKIKIRAKEAGDYIKLGGSLSSSGGYIQSTTNGVGVHLIAMNNTTWGAVSHNGSWTVA